jgi:hypothetical protein
MSFKKYSTYLLAGLLAFAISIPMEVEAAKKVARRKTSKNGRKLASKRSPAALTFTGKGLAVMNACLPDEDWKMPESLGKHKDLYENSLSDNPSSQAWSQLLKQRRTAKGMEQTLAEYFSLRMAQRLGWVGYAKSGFEGLAKAPDALPSVKLASALCLESIQRTHPDLTPTTEIIPNLKQILFKETKRSQERVRLVRLASIIGIVDPAAVEPILKPFESWAALNQIAKGILEEKDDLVIENAKKILYAKKIDPEMKKRIDWVRLQYARSLYNQSKFADALDEFKRVSVNSDYSGEATRGLTWSNLQLNQYPEAMSNAFTLLVGKHRNQFLPEAILVIAISMNETCNRSKALEARMLNTRIYGPLHSWLRKNEKGDHFALLMKSLRDLESTEVPKKVAYTWITDPTYFSAQRNLNVLLDEQKALKKYRRFEDAQQYLEQVDSKVKATQDKIVETLALKTHNMKQELDDVLKTLTLIEAEIYGGYGDQVIREEIAKNQTEAQDTEELSNMNSKRATWNWGKLDLKDAEGSEIWADELYAIRTSVTDQCPKDKDTRAPASVKKPRKRAPPR